LAAYAVAFASPAQRALARLPEKVATAVVEFLYGSLAGNPRRVGKALVGEVAGTWSARRGDYRVLHVIDDEARVVTVLTMRTARMSTAAPSKRLVARLRYHTEAAMRAPEVP
jgi:mRNA-degrading endonuclease RelE of RelBE toxin-antitoxin system